MSCHNAVGRTVSEGQACDFEPKPTRDQQPLDLQAPGLPGELCERRNRLRLNMLTPLELFSFGPRAHDTTPAVWQLGHLGQVTFGQLENLIISTTY